MTSSGRAVYDYVLARDRGCVAPVIDEAETGSCGPADASLPRTSRFDARVLTREHVQVGYGRLGKRAETDPQTVVILCAWHHLGARAGSTWALANKPRLREYLAVMEGTIG